LSTPEHTASQRLGITQRVGILRPDSIRNKILAFAILAALLPSLAMAWFSYLENKQSLTAKAAEELLGVSAQTAREVDLWIKERRYDLRVFASSYEVTENLERIRADGASRSSSARPYRHLSDFLGSVHERFPDYGELLAVDAAGRVVATSADAPAAAALPADWRDPRGDPVALGRPYWNGEAARPEVVMAVPVGIASEAKSGWIVARVRLQMLAETLARLAPGDSGLVFLAGQDGQVHLGSGSNSAATLELRYPPEEFRARLDGPLRAVEYANVLGQPVLGSAHPVPGQDWVVVSEMPLAEVFDALGRIRQVTLMIVVGMLVVAGSLGYALGLFIVRPLDRLTRGAAKVASGDLAVDLPVAAGGEVGYLTEVFNNMVARLRAGRSELERLSVTDFLTGLNNRRRMMEALENEVLRSRRLHHRFSVLIADVDRFKQYNDAHGHPAGDEVLKRVALVLCECARDVDFIARYGGEEFFLMMPEVGAAEAAERAAGIRRRLAEQNFANGAVTLSIGVAEFPAHGESGETLIAAADAALYEAKREGRDSVKVAKT
jgi:diguanylate cyclase (GGDEF)-like protein